MGAAILMMGSMAFAASAPGDWPGWLGPNRDNKSTDTGLLKEWPANGPKLVWKADGIGHGYSTVAVVDGVVYTVGDVGELAGPYPQSAQVKIGPGAMTLFAFDVKSGKLLWKTEHGPVWTKDRVGSRTTPVVSDGKVYVEGADGSVACYDAKTGAQVWKHMLSEFGGKGGNWGYAESVLIYKDLAVVTPGGRSTTLVALDKNTGKEVWKSQGTNADAQYGSPLAFTHDGVEAIIVGTKAGLVCVSVKDGSTFFTNAFAANNTANCPTPAYSDGYIFWSNGYNKGGICLKISAAGGKLSAEEAWRTMDMVTHHGGYVIHEGYIYGNHANGFACLELKTGKKMWFEQAVGKGSICYADGMLYLFGENGGKVALATCSPKGLEIKGRFQVDGAGPSWAHPVVAGGRLYLRYDTNLYCYDVKGEKLAVNR
jgi:outer membrane protein assembly factor BamB